MEAVTHAASFLDEWNDETSLEIPMPEDVEDHFADAEISASNEEAAVPDKEVAETDEEDAEPGADSDSDQIDQLIPVHPAKEWYGFKFSAQFILDDGTLFPPMSRDKHDLFLRIQGALLDPRLQILLEGLDYPILAEFRAKHTGRLRLQPTDQDDGGIFLEIRLDFSNYVSIGLSATQPDATIEAIRQEMISTLATGRLHLHVGGQSKKVQELISELEKYFDEPTATPFGEPERPYCVRFPWYPYLNDRASTPMTQFGQLKKRRKVQSSMEGREILKAPASNHFFDVQEASIKLVYGAYLEYRISTMHLQRISNMAHKIFIFSVPDSQVLLGAVQFKKLRASYTPELMADAAAIVPDGTSCTIKVDHQKYNKGIPYDAVLVPSVFQLPVAYDTLFLLMPSGETQAGMTNPLPLRDQSLKHWTCKLFFELSPKNIKTQVNAINTLCATFPRWHPILLNHDYGSLGYVDVFQGLKEEKIQHAYEEILALKKWNSKQTSVFRLLRQVPGDGFAFIEGIFGCGKTVVQAVLAKLLTSLGKRVLIVAPTNAAIQAISNSIIDNVGDVEAVRVVFAASEKFKKFAPHHDSTDQAETEEAAVFRLLQAMTLLRTSRYDVAPQHDLQNHVDKLVASMMAKNESLIFTYSPESEQVRDPNADSDDEDGEHVEESPKHDAIAVYNQLKDTDFTKPPRDDDPGRDEWRANKLAASDLIRQNFAASGSEGIVIIADEDGQSLEPVAWIPIVLLRPSDQVRAVLRFGDREQLPPLAISATSPFSEFGGQINRSLFDRHLINHPPAVALNIQYRMHPMLSQFPNQFTYKGRIVNGRGTDKIKIEEIYQARLIEWAKQYLPKHCKIDAEFARLLAVEVQGAEVDTDQATLSRSNKDYVRTLSELLDFLFCEEPYPKSTIKIITAYSAQKSAYISVLKQLQQRTGLPFSSLPSIATIDSMQGHEADVVLLDWVNVYEGPLGFLKDNRRANVALSRAHASLVVFFSQKRFESQADLDNKRPSEKRAKKPMPIEALKHWDWMCSKSKNIVIPPLSNCGVDTAVVDKNEADAELGECWNQEGDDQHMAATTQIGSARPTRDENAAWSTTRVEAGDSWEQEADMYGSSWAHTTKNVAGEPKW